MTFPIRLERDTHIVDWATYPVWVTADTDVQSSSFNVRSDGLLKITHATLDIRGKTGVIAADKARMNGIHITGPEAGTDFTPYAISATGWCNDPDGRCFLFVGNSPAVLTSAAGGDVVIDCRFVQFGGRFINVEKTLVVAEGTADRGLCVGVGVIADNASALADLQAAFSLSVRRLIDAGPRIIDQRKL